MLLLGLLQAGGSVLGQAMERVTGGNLLSMLLIACAFTLGLVYLFRLAVGHLAPMPPGAVSAPRGPGRGTQRPLWPKGEPGDDRGGQRASRSGDHGHAWLGGGSGRTGGWEVAVTLLLVVETALTLLALVLGFRLARTSRIIVVLQTLAESLLGMGCPWQLRSLWRSS